MNRWSFSLHLRGGGDGPPRTVSGSLVWFAVLGAFVVLWVVGVVHTVRTYAVARAQAERYADLSLEVESLRLQNQRLRVLESELKELRDLQQQMLRLAGIETALGVDLQSLETLRAALEDSMRTGEVGFIWPVSGDIMRDHESDHPALDIQAPRHRAVLAVGRGVVAEHVEDPVDGHRLVLEHADTLRTLYANLELNLVDEGDTVRTGQVIGLVGVGYEGTMPHLHFEVLEHGRPVSPWDWLPGGPSN